MNTKKVGESVRNRLSVETKPLYNMPFQITPLNKKSMYYRTFILILAVVLLFSISLIPSTTSANKDYSTVVYGSSSGEGDNTKSYNPETKTVTIDNWYGFGGTIAEVTLLDNTYYCLTNCEATIRLDLKTNYKAPLKELSFIPNIKNYQLQLRDNGYECNVNDYKEVCTEEDIINENLTKSIIKECKNVLIGNHNGTCYNWNKFDSEKELILGTYYIKIKGTKNPYDNVEWIPNFLGLNINEWAQWNSTMSTGLVLYYNMSDASGVIRDSTGKYNGTNTGADYGATGIIDKALNFVPDTDYVDIASGEINFTAQPFSINAWIKPDSLQDTSGIITGNSSGAWGFYLHADSRLCLGKPTISEVCANALDYVGVWSMVTVTANATGMFIYKNATFRKYSGPSYTFTSDPTYSIGRSELDTKSFDGVIDEVGIWNRSLSAGEISDLWNNGTGISYAPAGNTAAGNTAPFFRNITLYNNVTTTAYGQNRQFNASTFIEDIDNDKLNISFNWIKINPYSIIKTSTNVAGRNVTNGNNGTEYFSSINLTSADYNLGFNYTLMVMACDGSSCNTSNWSTSYLFINNTLPTLNVSMNYSYSLYSTTDLNCTGNYSDLDGDSGNAFVWVYKNSIFFNQTNFTVTNGANFSHWITNISYKAGDTIICEFFSNDTWQKGLYKNITATIIGSQTGIYNLSLIINDTSRSSDKGVTFTIKDLNPLNYITAVIRWFSQQWGELFGFREDFGQVLNGSQQWTNLTGNISRVNLTKYVGDNITAVLEITTKDNISLQFNSSTMYINNTKPYFYNVTFWDNLTNTYLNSSSQFNCSATFGDLDNDLVNITFYWYEEKNNRLLSTTGNNSLWNLTNKNNGTEYYSSINLTSSMYRLGYNYSCRVRACDNFGCNFSNSTLLYINNTLPTISLVLNASNKGNYTTENLTVWNTSTADLDSDRVKVIYNWNNSVDGYTLLNLPFEGGSNDTYTKDYSGLNNNGIPTGAIYNSTGGYDGFGAYQFDGVNNNEYINLGDYPQYNLTRNYTISFWFKWYKDNESLYPNILIKSNAYNFYISNSSSNLVYKIKNETGNNDGLLLYTLIPERYYYVVLQSNDTNISLYINGNIYASIKTLGNLNHSNGNLLLGYTIGNKFNGTIDDVMIFNRSLSAEEIKFIFDNNTKTLSSQETKAGDNWQVTATANDGYQDGISNKSIIYIKGSQLTGYNVSIYLNDTSHNNSIAGFFESRSLDPISYIKAVWRWFSDQLGELLGYGENFGTITNGTVYTTNSTGNLTSSYLKTLIGQNITGVLQLTDESNNSIQFNTSRLYIKNTIPSFTQNYTLFINNSNLTYPSFGSNILQRILVNDNDGDKMIWCNFTITSPNNTIMVNNVNGTRYDSPNDYWWNSSSFLVDQDIRDYGTWNVTWICNDGFQESNEGINEFQIFTNVTTIFSVSFNPADYGFATVIKPRVGISNTTTLSKINITLRYPSDGIAFTNSTNTQDTNYYWNSSEFMLNETGNWKLEIFTENDKGYKLSQNYTFPVIFTVDYTRKNESLIGYSPTTGETRWCYNLSVSHNSPETFTFNISRSKWYNGSGTDSSGEILTNITPLTNTIGKSESKYYSVCHNFSSSIASSEYTSNLTITHISNGNYINITYNLTQFLWVDPPSGLPVAYGNIPTTGTICRQSLDHGCNLSESIMDYEDFTKDWYIENDGQFDLRQCVASLSGTNIGSLSYSFKYFSEADLDNDVPLFPDIPKPNPIKHYMKLRLIINPSPSGNYNGELNVNCVASLRGLYNQTLQSSYNPINNESNIPKINLAISSSGGTGNTGGNKGPIEEEKPPVKCNTNITSWESSVDGSGFVKIIQLKDTKECRTIKSMNYKNAIELFFGCESSPELCRVLSFETNRSYIGKGNTSFNTFCIETTANTRYGDNNLINITISDVNGCSGKIEVLQSITSQALLKKLTQLMNSPAYINEIIPKYYPFIPIICIWIIIFALTIYIWRKIFKFSGSFTIGIFISIILATGVSAWVLYLL